MGAGSDSRSVVAGPTPQCTGLPRPSGAGIPRMIERLFTRSAGDGYSRSNRPRCERLRRSPAVRSRKLGTIGSSRNAEIALGRNRGVMRFPRSSQLIRPGLVDHPAASAVITHAIVGKRTVRVAVVRHLVVVHVVDLIDVHVGNGPVVKEVMPAPVAAEVTGTYVPKTIVDAAVIADMGSPVAVMKAVVAAIIAPIARRPESSIERRSAPCPRHPVVAGLGIAPVAGRPKVVLLRGRWLVILWERRWRLVGFGHSLLPSLFRVAIRVGIAVPVTLATILPIALRRISLLGISLRIALALGLSIETLALAQYASLARRIPIAVPTRVAAVVDGREVRISGITAWVGGIADAHDRRGLVVALASRYSKRERAGEARRDDRAQITRAG